MDEVASPREERVSLEIGVPADVVDVQMSQEDDVVSRLAGRRGVQRFGQLALVLGCPVPEARRPDPGVDEHGHAAGADEVGHARHPPGAPREQLRVELPVRLPVLRRRRPDTPPRTRRAGRRHRGRRRSSILPTSTAGPLVALALAPEAVEKPGSDPGRVPRETWLRRLARDRCGANVTHSAHLPAHSRRRGLAVSLFPGDNRVAKNADSLDLGLHHIPRPQVERGCVGGEPGDPGNGARSKPRRRPSTRAPSSG